MKKLVILLALVATLAAGAGYLAGHHEQAPVVAAEQPTRKVLYWYDPMVPEQRFDKPGKSPFMDMDLMPRYADDAPEETGVAVSARQQQNLGMTTAQAQMRSLAPAFSAYATVTTDERSIQIVPAPASGVVESLYVRAPQQWVKAGEPLARLWIPEWTAAQQEYLAVRQLGDAALTQAARARLALQFMPDAIVRELERSGKPQTRLTLRAGRGGYVVKLDVREGARVEATQPLFELASLDPVWLVVDYAPGEMQTLNVGSEVIATAESFPGEAFHGRVSELLPQLETTTRTLKARIVLDNPQQRLKPGMFLTVTLPESAARPPVLAVPEEAVIDTGTQTRVLLATGEGHFRAVNVTTGIASGGWTPILSGVKAGDSVVTSGQFLIDSEASLRSALPPSTVEAPPVAAPAMEHQHDHNHAMHGGEVMP
ncbi:efflux RND transporter periplasmic adaptor subunit [Pseudescherichia sp.]|uniref:efflux RND transporter periplasmic adaptor subunit n=1 Tax=Pseudescherichia sp. TaxID=2055881 RepID=UPI0028A0B777|nr:efflux RND transporter periplasmic adaptor subunit [Pseudescherichia sp.]